MTIEQTTFLSSIGAEAGADGHSHFAADNNTLSLPANFITVIPYYGLLAINGPDTAKFLQGQTTCNLKEVDNSHSVAGAYCTPKGRMVSSFHIARMSEDEYLLRMRADIVDSTCATLAKYIVFSKAKQQNASAAYQLFGLAGENARSAIEKTFGRAPDGKWQTVTGAGKIAIQLDQQGLIYECWVTNEEAAACWQSLATDMPAAGSRLWTLLTIQQGCGEICAATVDLFIPQMLNYQQTGAVSFTKGCYTGQEIVARMQYRGKLKRRMYRVSIESVTVAAGEELFITGSEQAIGSVVNSVIIDQHSSEALAVLTNQDVAANASIITANGASIQLLDLPYAVDSDEAASGSD